MKDEQDDLEGELENSVDSVEEVVGHLLSELKDQDRLRDRMSQILTETANALKGDPPPLTLHDWSDLPEKAKELRAQRNYSRALLKELVASYAGIVASHPYMKNKTFLKACAVVSRPDSDD